MAGPAGLESPVGPAITPAPLAAPLLAGMHLRTRGSRGWRPVGTKDWMLVATLEGQGYVRGGRAERTLSRGDLLLIAPDTPQDYGSLDEGAAWTTIWAHFRPRPHWLAWLEWPRLAEGVMVLPAGDRLSRIEPELRRMVETAQAPTPLRLQGAMNALERVLITLEDSNPARAGAELDPRIRHALDLIAERLAEPVVIADLGREVGLSRSRFSVLFSEQVRLSPQAYVEAARLDRAAQLLLHFADWPVWRIAEEVGFASPFYFSSRFRRRFGLAPSDYRATARHGPEGPAG